MHGAKTIGIIGGGQLGRMLTLAAKPLGFQIIVVDPSPDSPAAQVGAKQITADLYNQKALKKLAEQADFMTAEIEHLDAETLKTIAKTGKPINPAPETIGLIQDKLRQKEFLKAARIPTADFAVITTETEAKKLLKKFGGKMLVKARHGAYDGRGNMLVKNEADLSKALKLFVGRQLYAEAYVPFIKELAVIVARDLRGNITTYPVVQTIHVRNICVEVLVPAPVSPLVKKRAEILAKKVASKLKGAGVYGIEMFLTKDDKVLVNEIAPRVHNSGHYTIEANRTSQFEQHIRAISGLPLGSTELVVPAAVMINILGERDGPTRVVGLDEVLSTPHTSVHIYGKFPTKIDRKMGHITVTATTLPKARKLARTSRAKLKI